MLFLVVNSNVKLVVFLLTEISSIFVFAAQVCVNVFLYRVLSSNIVVCELDRLIDFLGIVQKDSIFI